MYILMFTHTHIRTHQTHTSLCLTTVCLVQVGLQNVGQALQISFFGLLVLGAFAAVAADTGLLVAFGIESFAGLFEGGGIIESLQSLGAGVDGML